MELSESEFLNLIDEHKGLFDRWFLLDVTMNEGIMAGLKLCMFIAFIYVTYLLWVDRLYGKSMAELEESLAYVLEE